MIEIFGRASVSQLLRPISPRRQPRPLLERPMKRRRFGKTQLFSDLLQRQIRAAQMVDGDIPPQLILQLLKTGAFLAQMPAQGLRADVQVRSDGVEIRPACAVAAEQAAQAAAQAVAVVGA